MSVKAYLTRFPILRKLRARLPYRLARWKDRAMEYWGWDDPALLSRNIRGPSAELKSTPEQRDTIVWLADPRADDVCLDLGCGTGRVETFLAPMVKEIDAVDFSDLMVQTARQRLAQHANVRVYQNDGESLAILPAARFTLAWAELVFHHVPVEITRKYVGEVARVLLPGGRFICQLPRQEYYELNSRDVCGWMKIDQAESLMSTYFQRVRVWQDTRHIYAYVFK